MPDQEIQNAVIRHAREDMKRVPDASQLHPEAEYGSGWEAGKAFGKGVLKAIGQAVDRLVPQGRDELANLIFNGRAYWPGEQPRPMTINLEQGHGVHGPTEPPAPMLPEQPETSLDGELAKYASNLPTQDKSKGMER